MVDRGQKSPLEALPSEIRRLIYGHLFNNLSIHIQTFKQSILDLSNYPWQIAAVSRLLREETLPILRNTTPSSQLMLICEEGRFPDSVRRQLPTRVQNSIRHIKILSSIYHDEIKPSLRAFPNLEVLEFDLESIDTNPYIGVLDSYHGRGSGLPIELDLAMKIRRKLRQLDQDQHMPREGLERDYWPEDTLWQVLNMDRQNRGFDIVARQRCTGYYSPYTIFQLDLENAGLDRL